MITVGENLILLERPAPVPLYSSQIPRRFPCGICGEYSVNGEGVEHVISGMVINISEESAVFICQTTRPHISEDYDLENHYSENLI
jgi:hypothetical protein